MSGAFYENTSPVITERRTSGRFCRGGFPYCGKTFQARGALCPPLSVPEIEAKIQQQTEAAEKSVLEIIELLELLPAESTERIILELRHIDCKNWADICDTVYLTRTPCAKYYNRGLDALLRMSKVRRTLGLEEKAGG